MMREVLLLTALVMCFWSHAWAQSEGAKPRARIVFAGEMGKPGSQDVQARPGMRFGLELVPEGAPKGTSVVLEARLLSPKTPEGLHPIRWLVAARMGMPVQIAWEFAYDWEVEPGVWTMKVFLEETELASVPFTVARVASPTQNSKSFEPQDGRQAKSEEPSAHPQKLIDGAIALSGESGSAVKGHGTKDASETVKSPVKTNGAGAAHVKNSAPGDSVASPGKTASDTPQVDPGNVVTHDRKGSEHTKSSAPSPPNTQRVVGGKPDRRVYALMGGAYSEEARALRAASVFKARGVSPCLRVDFKNGKKLWHVVIGWRDSPEAARKAKAELLPVLSEVFVQPMSAKELETGLTCR